ncbi:MAG: spondin domain-containing protein [Capsulimonadales bacterium]|nr:spondin domain-containing protein [Capsulimonadales bacterium]
MLRLNTRANRIILWGPALLSTLWSAGPAHSQVMTYRITLENLTNSAPNSGQPFSPPVFFTHDGSLTLWTPGETASDPLRQIAEEGNNAPLLTDLSLAGSAVGTIRVLSGPQMPGTSQTFSIATDLSTHRFLSNVWMLGRTNDGFAGQASLDLNGISSTPVSFDLLGLDAGTEVNNELAAFLPSLGGPFNDPENGVVGLHGGIAGTADAPASWNFTGPVARLTIVAAAAPEPSTVFLAITGVLLAAGLRRRHQA